MENKKTFGAYICRRRKELGLTQREFADRLFVTESAVSKWERGMSYPDITLIRDICAILQVSEHELLTASEDVEARTAETLAKKYLSLLRRLRWIQYILYGGTALICLICNLAVGHTLDWFWLVLTGELVGASLTLLPILVKQYRGVITLGGFTLSLELLLLAACLFSGGDWFLLASAGVLIGLLSTTPSISRVSSSFTCSVSPSGHSTISSSWTWRTSFASRPASFIAFHTRIMASLITSAAVPWMGILRATRSPKERRLKLEDFSSGSQRRRPMRVET